MQSEKEFMEIGIGFLETFKYNKAIEYFSKAIEINPYNSESFELRGVSWFSLYNIEQSIEDTNKAINLDKENHRAWYNKGEILKYKKIYGEADQCYLEANRIYPDSLYYLTGLIQTTRAQK